MTETVQTIPDVKICGQNLAGVVKTESKLLKPEVTSVNTIQSDAGDLTQTKHYDVVTSADSLSQQEGLKRSGECDKENDETRHISSGETDWCADKKMAEAKRFVYILSLLATIGGFLFGYDIGIVAGSMLFIKPYFELSTFWQEAIVSGTIGAAAVAAIMAGWLTDKIGRKLTIMTSSVVFTIGGVIMGTAPTKELLLCGRVVCGLGVGLASVGVPVYVAEAAPLQIRGRLVSLHQTLINTGIVISSLVAGVFSYVTPDGWRYMLGIAAIPGAIQFVGFLYMPESPRWLIDQGRLQQAKDVLVRMRGQDDVSKEFDEILQTVKEAKEENAEGIYHILKIIKTPHVRKATLIGCSLLFFQQWCGINTVMYVIIIIIIVVVVVIVVIVVVIAVFNIVCCMTTSIYIQTPLSPQEIRAKFDPYSGTTKGHNPILDDDKG